MTLTVAKLSLTAIVFATAQPSWARPALVKDIGNAAYCLRQSDFGLVDRSSAMPLELRAASATKSSSSHQRLWVFVALDQGVFDAFEFEIERSSVTYRLWNNATFRWKRRTVQMINPLLGGVGTQETMERAFRRSLPAPLLILSSDVEPTPGVRCEYYFDK